MEKYLQRYAEPEVSALESLPDLPAWANVVVIPACNEATDLLRAPPPCGGRSLMILVINEPEVASETVFDQQPNAGRWCSEKFCAHVAICTR